MIRALAYAFHYHPIVMFGSCAVVMFIPVLLFLHTSPGL